MRTKMVRCRSCGKDVIVRLKNRKSALCRICAELSKSGQVKTQQRERLLRSKKCVSCGNEYQSTPDNFPTRGRKSRGSVCIHCILADIELRQQKILQQSLIARSMKRCHQCEQWKPIETSFHTDASNPDGYNYKCKDCVRAYYDENKDHLVQTAMQWAKAHPEKATQHRKAWLKKNPEKRREYARMNAGRRQARIRDLPRDLKLTDWQRALDYFNGCCAVCGRQLNDLFGAHKAAADHWIPISYKGDDNPGTVATNIVPLCHGEGGCNNQKSDKLPHAWLKEQYGTRKANQILQHIETYFEWVRNQSRLKT